MDINDIKPHLRGPVLKPIHENWLIEAMSKLSRDVIVSRFDEALKSSGFLQQHPTSLSICRLLCRIKKMFLFMLFLYNIANVAYSNSSGGSGGGSLGSTEPPCQSAVKKIILI